MKSVKEFIGYILVIIGFFLMAFANIAAIGTCLYDWAFNTTLALAAWNAFVLWAQMLGSGLAAFIIGKVLSD